MPPLCFNPATGEPFLRLPHPHEHVIITPPRLSDAPAVTNILNDPLVWPWLRSTPVPCSLEYALARTEANVLQCDAILRQVQGRGAGVIDDCPFQSIRAVDKETGMDAYIGEIKIERCLFMQYWKMGGASEEEASALNDENAGRSLGDDEIVWWIGPSSPRSDIIRPRSIDFFL